MYVKYVLEERGLQLAQHHARPVLLVNTRVKEKRNAMLVFLGNTTILSYFPVWTACHLSIPAGQIWHVRNAHLGNIQLQKKRLVEFVLKVLK